ncbi:MAG: A/G-specific adenine glycosylase [Saprospiraceae bacterium]|jgi:A/G-specific adenine glycosylase
MDKNRKKDFKTNLLVWFSQNHRPMPWKGERNPYYIWLSEIILQQTRVEQGLPYFLKFKDNFPTVQDLADASEDSVMLLWQGLGYYSRARNLHSSAKYIAYELNGEFPKTYDTIIKLKGVGTYTAAAISSFAYDLPYAVVDGNVYRVLSRYFGIETPIDTTEGKKEFSKLAEELIDAKRPADYNQAIMDFGATHCTPRNPKCSVCILNKDCIGFNTQKNDILPIKSRKIKKTERFFSYLLINYDNSVYLQKRTKKDIWQNLYQFPIVESQKVIDFLELQKSEIGQETANKMTNKTPIISKTHKQILTHQKIWATFYELELKEDLSAEFIVKENLIRVKKINLDKFAFPKIIDLFLKDKTLSLKLF